jgi:uncharacterized protein (DUF111 family)
MKKGRPGVTLTALAGPSELDAVQAVLFTESTTLGLRWHAVRRRALARLWTTVAVDGQPVRVKFGLYDRSVVTVAPEADDVRAAAARTGLPARTVHERAVALARSDAVGPASELVADDPRAGDQ